MFLSHLRAGTGLVFAERAMKLPFSPVFGRKWAIVKSQYISRHKAPLSLSAVAGKGMDRYSRQCGTESV